MTNLSRGPLTGGCLLARAFFGIGVIASMAAATWGSLSIALESGDRFSVIEIVLLALFLALFFWLTINFWANVVGFFALIANKALSAYSRRSAGEERAATFRPKARDTALVMPIYGEDPQRVAAALRTIAASLREVGALEGFDFFLLSDTRNPDLWLAEEMAWFELAESEDLNGRIFYRRRRMNTEKKAGNIREFLEEWGHAYTHMVVLDADSVIAGSTLVELVRRMEENPRLGLLQTRPQIVGGRTLYARTQQFASWVYGRLIAYGIAALQGPDGNYWGHNAIIRVEAFMTCCGLPLLPGRPPFGGEILSHDFVEAALLVRRGWQVRMAPDLEHSYEEVPPNLTLSLLRDRRWSQGNLQHLYILFARGFHPASRANFFVGIMAYISSPLWFLFIATSIVATAVGEMPFAPGLSLILREGYAWSMQSPELLTILALLGATAVMLFGPKLMGLVVSSIEHPRWLPMFVIGAIVEIVYSVLLAPITMIRHTQFVVAMLRGQNVGWNPQQREDTVTWAEGWQAYRGLTALGIGATIALFAWNPATAPWFMPLLAGLMLSVPIAVLSGRPYWPIEDTPANLFAVPMGPNGQQLLAASRERRENIGCDVTTMRILDDPAAHALHTFVLSQGAITGGEPTVPQSLLDRCRGLEVPELSAQEKSVLFSSTAALRTVFRERWQARHVTSH